jgi:tRNA G18 (ribose-2'-O)-methylase SpoU
MTIESLFATVHHHDGIVVALTPRREAATIKQIPLVTGPLALIFGAEGYGLPDDTLRAADFLARIPIVAEVDSLNVGHAAAVAFALTFHGE